VRVAWLMRDIIRLILDGTVSRRRVSTRGPQHSVCCHRVARAMVQKYLLSIHDMGGEKHAAGASSSMIWIKRGEKRPEFVMVDGAPGPRGGTGGAVGRLTCRPALHGFTNIAYLWPTSQAHA